MYSLNGRTERQRIFNNWSIQENQLFFAASLHRLIGLSELTCTLAWPQLIPTGLEKKTKTNWECFAKSQANCPPKAGYINWAEQTNNYQHVKSLHNCTALVILGISATNAGCHSKHSPLAFSAPDSSIAKCVIFMGGRRVCKCDMMWRLFQTTSTRWTPVQMRSPGCAQVPVKYSGQHW